MGNDDRGTCPICGGLEFVYTDKGTKLCRCVYEKFDVAAYLNIPPRFRDATIRGLGRKLSKGTIEQIRHYVKNFENFYRKGVGLLLVGPTGVGKTYTASAILKYLYDRYRVKGYFLDTKELAVKLRERFAEGKLHPYLEMLARYPILVLDDLGNETLSDWLKETLVALISRRYNDRRVTIITTNYYPGYLLTSVPDGELKKYGMKVKSSKNSNPAEGISDDLLLEKRIGSHLVSRLAEMTFPILMEGLDKRIKKVMR